MYTISTLALYLIVISLLISINVAVFSLDLSDGTSLCDSKETIAKAVENAIIDNELLVVYSSASLKHDGYASLYAGWLRAIFTSSKFKTRMLFVDTQGMENYFSMTSFLLSVLPEESIFVSFDHGWAVRRLSDIINLKSENKVNNIGIFHLNHEQPWLVNVPNTFHNDYVNETSLFDLYNKYNDSLIFRNYVHPDLENVSVQLPVGPSFYDYWINNPLSGLQGDTPASKRKIGCRFIGRKQYTMSEKNYSIKERDMLFYLGCDGDDHAEFYQNFNLTSEDYKNMSYPDLMAFTASLELYQTSNYPTSRSNALSITNGNTDQDIPFPCQVFSYPPGNPLHYEFYMKVMVATRFVPCPPGNNPETFRHYETLETGGIPLILKSPEHSDYLYTKHWRDYPGPLFDNWEQAALFVLTTSLDEVDALQSRIQDWYHHTFKIRIKSTVEDEILAHYPKLATGISEDMSSPVSGSGSNAVGGDVNSNSEDDQAISIRRLKADIIRMKLDASNMYDYVAKLEGDIVTLASGINSLMAANHIYNRRIGKLESEKEQKHE